MPTADLLLYRDLAAFVILGLDPRIHAVTVTKHTTVPAQFASLASDTRTGSSR